MNHVYSVYDRKSEIWGNPFVLRSNGEAVRGFMDAARNPETMLHKFPEDFVLFQIGTFDEVEGTLMPCDNPVNLGSAASFLIIDRPKVVKEG